MPRRRASDPTKAISITLKQSLLDRLDRHLSYDASRSAYIARALEAMLDQKDAFSIFDLSSSRIRAHLFMREDTSSALKMALNAEEMNAKD